MNENFEKWCKINGELSAARDEAEKIIKQYARDEVSSGLINCYNDLEQAVGVFTAVQEHDVRLAIARMATDISGNIFSLNELLESHGGNTSPDASFRYVKKGVDAALEEEFGNLHELWKVVNT